MALQCGIGRIRRQFAFGSTMVQPMVALIIRSPDDACNTGPVPFKLVVEGI